MEKIFNSLGQSLFSELNDGEDLILSFYGENSQFVRFNNASVRQTGLVDDADIGLKFIANGRTCGGGFTVSGNFETDLKRGRAEIDRMRSESNQIPEDPFLVMPENSGSSHEIKKANGLAFDDAVDAILPAVSGVDFVGIARALFTNLRRIGSDQRLVGASTITQQVAKNFFLTNL